MHTKKYHILTYRKAPEYPNAADNSYYAQKLLDITTAIASGIGLIFSLLFLVTIM